MSIAGVVVVTVVAASFYSLFVVVVARLCGMASRSSEGPAVGGPASRADAADRTLI
jgi:hypothetical protein